MADSRAILRVQGEFLWTLRRAGVLVAPSQAIDAARAAAAVGFDDRETLREALACVLVTRRADRRRFDATFDAFFVARTRGDLWERLLAQGFSADELAALRAALVDQESAGADFVPLGALLEGGAELDRLLLMAGVARTLRQLASPMQVGFFTHRVAGEVGLPAARRRLGALRSLLMDALGARGEALVEALLAELDRSERDVRAHVSTVAEERDARDAGERRRLLQSNLVSLDPAEVFAVRRAVREFAARLRGAERVRRRRALRGRIDPHRTLRRALRTAGVPFAPVRRKRRRDRPKLLLLCDVSDSVRAVATFLLEFVSAAHDLFEHTRSFVFVSEIGESTELFERGTPEAAIAQTYGGGVVSVVDNSNYGRAFRSFAAHHLDAIDGRTTVVVLGDGRSNFHEAGEDALAQVSARARAVVWLCPEPRATWGTGDSAMARYEPLCTEVLEVRSAEDLENAARRIVARR